MPFFNPVRPSYIADPYPALARLRAEAPVYYSREIEAWIVTSYPECLAVLHDDETYSSDALRARGRLGARLERVKRRSVLGTTLRIGQTDPPDHARLRSVVARAFTPRYVESMRPVVDAEARSLLASVSPGEPFDLMASFADRLPRAVIAAQLGAPPEDRDRVMGWARDLMQTVNDDLVPARRTVAEAARDGLLGYLARVAAGETGDPDSLLAGMARAEEAQALTPEELLALTIDLALAGNDTTANLIGNGALALMRYPEEQQRLRGDLDGLLASAVEEMLRFDPPQQAAARVATTSTTLRGEAIAEGDVVMAMLSAANRDPAVFPDPDRFDVGRAGERHLSMGMGIHYCIGSPLGKLEAELAFRALFERLPVLRLAGGARLPRTGDWMLRSVRSIPVDTSDLPGTLDG